MRIESALYSSREGMNAHGQAIAVVSDNIANVNTTGFKSSRVEFADLMADGAEGRDSDADRNSGAGVSISSVRPIHKGGVIEATGRALDLAIDGNGFFMVGDAADPRYTRAGNFQVTGDGLLVSGDGETVLGYTGSDTATLGTINLLNPVTSGTPTSAVTLLGNLDASEALSTPPENPETFKDINQAASHVANYTVYDSLGTPHDISVGFFKSGVGTWQAQAYIDGGDVTGGTAGVPVAVGAAASLTFSPTGTIDAANKAAAQITVNPTYANGASAGNFTVDYGSFTQFSATSQLTGINQNGAGIGNVKQYEVDSDGKIYAVLDSGSNILVGAIPLAEFVNQDGLDRSGNNAYKEGTNAGDKTVDAAGNSGLGKIEGGALERSTVELADEFVNLVIFQRGYQANSQSFSTASSMIRDTLGLIR